MSRGVKLPSAHVTCIYVSVIITIRCMGVGKLINLRELSVEKVVNEQMKRVNEQTMDKDVLKAWRTLAKGCVLILVSGAIRCFLLD